MAGLTKKQIDTLWSCLALNCDSCDHMLKWLFLQVRARQCHALTIETFKYIYTDKVRLSVNIRIMCRQMLYK